jgi:hypothetical protein
VVIGVLDFAENVELHVGSPSRRRALRIGRLDG